MNNTTVGLIFFTAGAAAGFFTARALLKQRYEQLAQEEIDSVKAAFARHEKAAKKKEKEPQKKEEQATYRKYVETLQYTQPQEEAPMELKPHVISPDDFGDMDNYDEISLTYYADGTLTDDHDHPMSDEEIEETVGRNSLTHFGEYEQDSVFVRNDKLKADYEILLDPRTYAQVLQERPWLT